MTFNDLMDSTLSKYSPTIADNVTKQVALLAAIEKAGNLIKESGGVNLVETIECAENSTFKWYAGYELLDISATNVLSQAVYDWKQCNVNVTVSGIERRNNKESKTRIYNLIKAKIQNAENTAKNNVARSLFSNGTGSGGKEIGGLKLVVSDNPATSVVGGISAAENPFWMNQTYSLATNGGVTGAATPADIVAAMDEIMLRCSVNGERPDIIIMGYNYYVLYKRYLQSIKRIVNEKLAIGEASFSGLEYDGVPVLYDSFCDANRAYFLTSKYLQLHVHEDAFFSQEAERTPVNQDAGVWPLLFQGNLTCSNRSRQGVIMP